MKDVDFNDLAEAIGPCYEHEMEYRESRTHVHDKLRRRRSTKSSKPLISSSYYTNTTTLVNRSPKFLPWLLPAIIAGTVALGAAAASNRPGPPQCIRWMPDLFFLGIAALQSDQYQNRIMDAPSRLAFHVHRSSNGRVEGVHAFIRREHLGQGTSTNDRIRVYARSMGERNDDAGHIIAQGLGGSGTMEENIFPQNSNINRGAWREAESMVRDVVEADGQVEFSVIFTYDNARSTRPSSFIYRISSSRINFVNDMLNPRNIGGRKEEFMIGEGNNDTLSRPSFSSPEYKSASCGKRLIGYFPSWGNTTLRDTQAAKLSHVVFAFFQTLPDGTIRLGSADPNNSPNPDEDCHIKTKIWSISKSPSQLFAPKGNVCRGWVGKLGEL